MFRAVATTQEQGARMESSADIRLSRGTSFIAGGVCAGLAKYYGWKKGGLQACFVDNTRHTNR